MELSSAYFSFLLEKIALTGYSLFAWQEFSCCADYWHRIANRSLLNYIAAVSGTILFAYIIIQKHIDSVGENIDKNSRMLPDIRLGDVHQQLLNDFSFAIPRRITAEKQEVKIAGSAVFDTDNHMVGFLGEEEPEGLNFLTGKVRGGVVKAKINNDLVVMNIQGAKKVSKPT